MYCILCCFSVCRKCSSFGCRRRLARIFWKFLRIGTNVYNQLSSSTILENVVITLVAQIVITNFYNWHSHFHMKLLRSKLVSWLQSLTYKDSLSGVRSIIIVLILLENSKLFIFIVSLSNFFLIYLFTYTYKALLITFDVAICIDPIFAIVIVEKKADSNRRVLNVGP